MVRSAIFTVLCSRPDSPIEFLYKWRDLFPLGLRLFLCDLSLCFEIRDVVCPSALVLASFVRCISPCTVRLNWYLCHRSSSELIRGWRHRLAVVLRHMICVQGIAVIVVGCVGCRRRLGRLPPLQELIVGQWLAAHAVAIAVRLRILHLLLIWCWLCSRCRPLPREALRSHGGCYSWIYGCFGGDCDSSY
jgi:hypothetical protein